MDDYQTSDLGVEEFFPDKTPTDWELHSQYSWTELYGVPVPLYYKKLHPNAKPPEKAGKDELGIDIRCIFDEYFDSYWQNKQEKTLTLYPGRSHTFHTGLAISCPKNYGFLFRDRSSLGSKDIIHSAGVIDSTYRGEWLVHLINVGKNTYKFSEGDKIIQAVLVPCIPISISAKDQLDETVRGIRGFGSSGR